MKPTDIIYTVKAILGAVTALICLLLGVEDIITGVGIAMLIYLGSDRILKQIFIEKVEKATVTKTGMGIFVITWLFLWILLYTFTKSLPS